MNIIKREMKANIKPLIIWIAVISFIMFGASIEFASFQGDPGINEAMDQFKPMFDAMGAVGDMTTAEGFLSMVSIYIYLPLVIYSGLLGSSIISKEEKDRTAEYLFTLPINRYKVIFSKMVVAFIYSFIINVSIIFTVFLSFGRYDVSDFFTGFMINLSIGVFLTQMIFLTIGMFLSASLRQYKKSGSILISILIGTYMLSMLVGIVEKAEFLKYIIPFQYFPIADMAEGNFELIYIIITTIIVVTTTYGTFYFYKRRDLYI